MRDVELSICPAMSRRGERNPIRQTESSTATAATTVPPAAAIARLPQVTCSRKNGTTIAATQCVFRLPIIPLA